MDFQHIPLPNGLRYPGAYIEIDPSLAGRSNELAKVLLVGQKLATGSAAAGEIIKVNGGFANYKTLFGQGSILADMAKTYRDGDVIYDLYALPLSDNPAGVQATGTITVTNPATASGTLALYLAGVYVAVGINSTDSVNNIATNIATAINDNADLPCSASSSLAVVTLTARHQGTVGNNIDIRLNLYNQITPTDLALTISAFSGGSGDPTLPDLEATLGVESYNYLIIGSADDATLAALHNESQRRFQPPIQDGFRVFGAIRGDQSSVETITDPKNYEHISLLALQINPTATWSAAAAYAAACIPALQNNPAKSIEGQKMVGMIAQEYYTFSEANSLLFKGASIMEVASDGSCYIKRPITLYQQLSDGTPDDAYLDINTPETIERIRKEQRQGAIRNFRGTTAAKNKEDYKAGLKITTEEDIKAYLLSLYKRYLLAERGWVQNYEEYKKSLVVQQNADDATRFDFNDKPILTSPYYILAGRMSFLKRSTN